MQLVIFHSRTGAAALAAALSHAKSSSREHFLRQAAQLPGHGRWLLCQHLGDQTVLAAAHGRQPYVFRQAVLSLAAEFAPAVEVKVLPQPEPGSLRRLVWLWRQSWLPGLAREWLGKRLWRYSCQRKGV
jgi:hypothetical protein